MEIPTGAQIFDLVFHPTFAVVYAGLLTGYVKAFTYDSEGNYESTFTVQPSKRSCRGLSINEDGSQLYAVGKAKSFHIIDTMTQRMETRIKIHDSTINRVKCITHDLVATGDDDGFIKLWDPRRRDCLRTYRQHFDYISDFLWLDDKKQLVATSGDGSLSVMDVRAKKQEPIAHSEDQEDELLSIVTIKGGAKAVVGTQLGVLSIFNRSKGWGDCVDRVPGHPMSIDALCNLPSDIPGIDAGSTILTGSSDGYVRAVQLFPTKLLGAVTDHGEWPVERLAVGEGRRQLTIEPKVSAKDPDEKSIHRRGNEGSGENGHLSGPWWVGSVGHEEILRLSNLNDFFCKGEERDAVGESETGLAGASDDAPGKSDAERSDSDGDHKTKKRKHKREKDPLKVKKKKGRNELEVDGTFFNGL